MSIEILRFLTLHLQDSIRKHHELYDFPIKDITAENILVRHFQDNGKEVIWETGSHKPGSDIHIVGQEKGYSVKSAKQPIKETSKYLQISSYRTTSHPTLSSKIEYIKKIEETIESYIVFARTESKANKTLKINYFIYLINPSIFDISSFTFTDVGKDYVGENNFGVKIAIVNNMSGQIWLSLPMDLLRKKNEYVKEICSSGEYVIGKRKINSYLNFISLPFVRIPYPQLLV